MNKDRVKEKARARHKDTETHMFVHMGLIKTQDWKQ